ncbi:MAG: tyrosine-type recombinase/integrase [Candidatus Polarisedimenticolaceae bacterium]|nr:tyrosine-type recombinase/integrase [Candidatus Polarisedimenticolaceae bacterium]
MRKNRAGKITIQFEYKYRSGKKSRTVKVEQWPNKSLAEIRAIHREIKTDLSKGIDPIETRKTEKLQSKLNQAQELEKQQQELERLALEAATRRTFSDAIAQWEKLELSRRKGGGKESMRAINKDILPTLGDMALVDIKRVMLIDILDGVVERGARVMANHLFGDLRQFFNFAIAREWVDGHPLAGLTKEKIGGRQKERDRYLSEEEIITLNQQLPAANLLRTTERTIWIMLSTCCRVGELSQARWEDVNIDGGEWFIPAGNSKNAKNHTIFLSDFAKQQFQAMQTITKDTDWCLPARNGKSHINLKSITKQIKDRVRSESLANRTMATGTLLLSGGAWTPHDLRRTGATMMGELGVMGEVIERCLNHVEQNKLKRIYQRHELKAEQKEAWRLLGERLTLLHSFDVQKNIVIGHFQQKDQTG